MAVTGGHLKNEERNEVCQALIKAAQLLACPFHKRVAERL
jgi:hypothetical protein